MSTRSWQLSVNTDTSVAYIRMSRSDVSVTVEANDEILVDLDEHDVVVGIELLRLDAQIPATELMMKFHVHSDDVDYLLSLLPSIQARMQFAADGVNAVVPEQTLQTA